jgi:RimJ/RimL family protein N-acetyltransferase
MIAITPLQPEQIPALLALHGASPPGYDAFFAPFSFDEPTLRAILRERRRDEYFALFWDGHVAGLAMLRGFDAGFSVPSFGVWVAHAFSGRGLARTALSHCIARCRALGCQELMLKVHPANRRAWRIYADSGFVQTGVDARNGHLVMRKAI